MGDKGDSGHVLVYVTAKDGAEATRLGRMLVEAKLAACVNVLGPIRSIYRWEGEVREEGEVSLIAKTRRGLAGELIRRIVAEHSYQCPCVVLLPIEGGNPPFLKWIDGETGG